MCPTTATPAIAGSGDGEDTMSTMLAKLVASHTAISTAVDAAAETEAAIAAAGDRVTSRLAALSATLPPTTTSSSHLQSQAVAARALHARIDRAVAPALPLLAAFRRVSSLAAELTTAASPPTGADADAKHLLDFVDGVDQLREAIDEVAASGEAALRRLAEAVGFLGRTKAAERGRVRRLTEAVAALRAVYEAEVEEMRFEGPLDELLLRLQDLLEALLLRLKHPANSGDVGGEGGEGVKGYELGTEMEVEVAARMARTLAGNHCLDICLDIYVKARYRRSAKALMRLNPTYLKVYTPNAIDAMEWESLEAAMALWIPHLQVALASVLTAERRLCMRTLSDLPAAPADVWPECFAKIAARIVSAFFRFGEGVAAAAWEPQRLFKLLDMLDALFRSRPLLDALFAGESPSVVAIRDPARALERSLARAAAGVFYEFGLRIETHHLAGGTAGDAGYVPKIVRYAVNYLKCLASGHYGGLMDTVLRAERAWKSCLDDDGDDGSDNENALLLAEAISNVLEALHRHVEAARRTCDDEVAAHVTAMNAYWYIYMRTRGSELAKLLGDEVMKKKYKAAAEEAAWAYQDTAWNPLVRLLGKNVAMPGEEEEAREKAAALFADMLSERVRRHGRDYKIPDGDLREQIKAAVVKTVVAAYTGFLPANGTTAGGGSDSRELLPPDSIEEMVSRVFDEMGDGGAGGGGRSRSNRSRRESRESNLEGFEG